MIFTSSSTCRERTEREREQNNLKSLVRQRTVLSNPQEVVKFETWFNPNCATCVNHDNYYRVFLIICEPSQRGMSEIPLQVFPKDNFASQWGTEMRRESHNCLPNAQREAEQVRNKLKNHPNPILMIFSSLTLHFDEGYSFEKAGVVKYDLPSDAINNPDQYIKPLDIVKVGKEQMFGLAKYQHVAIYLGSRKVYHIYDLTSTKSTSNMKAQIDNWSDFLKNRIGLPVRYHCLIPFKHKEIIVNHSARAVVDKYKEGKYSVFEENCEHFASMIVYGIDFSEQIEKRRKIVGIFAESLLMSDPNDPFPIFTPDPSHFEEEINLRRRINETNEKLDNLAKYKNSEVESKKQEIKKYVRQELIEIPLKSGCRIM